MTNQIKKRLGKAEKVERAAPLPLRRETAQAAPFPVKSLGKILGDGAMAIVDKVGCPPEIAAQSVLAVAALATQAHADVIHPVTQQARPLSLFVVTVAASGERKSAADNFALAPVKLREAELYEKHERDERAYRDARTIYDRSREVILKSKLTPQDKLQKLTELGPMPAAPLIPLLTAPDPTLEGLHKLLVIGEPSMGLFNDEGGTFVGGYGMSDESRLRTGAGLSKMWDGDPVKRVRGGDGVTVLRGRRLSLHIMVQPGIAETLLADPTLQQQGLPSRFLVSAPPSLAGTRMQKPEKRTTEPALKKYNDRLLKLLRKPQRRASVNNPELRPQPIALSKAAREKWIKLADECERRLGVGQHLEAIRPFANKMPEQTLRIAAVLTLVDDPNATEIGVNVFERATQIAWYYAGEALRLFEQGTSSVELQHAERLLGWLHEGWQRSVVGISHVYQRGPNAIRNAAKAREIMSVLEHHYWVSKIDGGTIIDGKRHREAWDIFTS